MMIPAETLVPKKKLKVKFSFQKTQAVLGTQFSLTDGADQSKDDRYSMPGSKKRGPPGVIEGQKEKRPKMDRGMTLNCSSLLNTLIKHPAGWVFSTPVDPVALKIPDYFRVISEPMDLGTVKSKLQKNVYAGMEEFAADVRLTFSNALLYNPPGNEVHKMAQELSHIFEMKWKFLEEKWRGDIKNGLGKIPSVRTMELYESGQNCPKTPPLSAGLLPKKSKTFEGKAIRTVRSTESAQKCSHKVSEKSSYKGTNGKVRSAVDANPSLSLDASNCGRCSFITCRCSLPSDSTHASSSDLTSERSFDKDHRACSVEASRLDCQAKSTLTSQTSKSDLESDGAVSASEDGNSCPTSQLSAPADVASGEGWSTPIFDVQVSPKRALRAAMIKSRFADTILRAQQKTLLDNGDKADPAKLQQEKKKLEKRQLAEKARIEAQIRAAESAERMREEIELKKQREKEREAARIALQKMERTVEIEQNLESQKELELLSGCSLDSPDGSKVAIRNPLTQLGLFIKDDYLVDEDEEAILYEGEEGEIFL
ncbi:Bromodomain domain-containing protein [Cephalotus follicularis]|uniref:Bromodomain domain-containing protein n=1 Tax=Cephalotus follicularis TaxID=3775 RepID=A0A1Q3CPT1_CEPFO|nr:Bromodomain domain-containing protein [Cephalotus follicularis]